MSEVKIVKTDYEEITEFPIPHITHELNKPSIHGGGAYESNDMNKLFRLWSNSIAKRPALTCNINLSLGDINERDRDLKNFLDSKEHNIQKLLTTIKSKIYWKYKRLYWKLENKVRSYRSYFKKNFPEKLKWGGFGITLEDWKILREQDEKRKPWPQY